MCIRDSTYSVPQDITTNIVSNVATFENVDVFQGIYLTKQFTIDTSTNQRFILNNADIDTSTIVVKVGTREYKQISNIVKVDGASEIYLLQEIADERYELLFGDGIIGKKLENGDVIQVLSLIHIWRCRRAI